MRMESWHGSPQIRATQSKRRVAYMMVTSVCSKREWTHLTLADSWWKPLTGNSFVSYIWIWFYLHPNTHFSCSKIRGAKEQDCVIGLYHRGGHLWAAPHCERDLALLAVIHGQTLQHKAAQTGSSATTASIVHAEPLQTLDSLSTRRKQYCTLKHEKLFFILDTFKICVLIIPKYKTKRTLFAVFWPVQLSASLRIRSSTKSTISFPMV